MAPFMAADALRRNPFTLGDLLRELSWPVPTDVGFLESAGGVRSPITSDGADSIDLADAISPELVLLVADAGLGTISAVRLCLSALSEHRTAVILNQYQSHHELHRRNRDWLREHFVGLPVLTDLNHVGRLIYE
jgi:dethiobiotin synthetase